MNLFKVFSLAAAALLAAAGPATAMEIPARDLPAPTEASPELQKMIEAGGPNWGKAPASVEEMVALRDASARAVAEGLPALRKALKVEVEKGEMGGVPVYTLTPADIPERNRERILLHLHGGGYVFNPGEAATQEAIYLAGIGGFRVVSVDYRMAPEFPYPAAMDDAMKVYEALLKKYPAQAVGVFGTSTGGGMTLALVLRAKKEGLPLPGAIAPGTPWTDLTKTGDSYFANAGVDDVLVRYEGLLEAAAKSYAAGHDMRDPLISPVYGDVSGFPPAILGTGTRDLFLSNTVRMHRKLREAGATADLLVLEGLSHAQYMLLPPEAPEAQFYFREVARFFERHLK